MINFIKNIFKKKAIKPTGHVHDYTCCNVGMMEIYDNGMKISICGFGYGVRSGDYVKIQGSDKRAAHYIVQDDLYYCNDPKDQWFATLLFPQKV